VVFVVVVSFAMIIRSLSQNYCAQSKQRAELEPLAALARRIEHVFVEVFDPPVLLLAIRTLVALQVLIVNRSTGTHASTSQFFEEFETLRLLLALATALGFELNGFASAASWLRRCRNDDPLDTFDSHDLHDAS
jgi:hypothetical protein